MYIVNGQGGKHSWGWQVLSSLSSDWLEGKHRATGVRIDSSLQRKKLLGERFPRSISPLLILAVTLPTFVWTYSTCERLVINLLILLTKVSSYACSICECLAMYLLILLADNLLTFAHA